MLLAAERRIDFIAHLTVTMFVGVMALAPAGLLSLLPLPWQVQLAIACVSAIVGVALMYPMQRRRSAALGLSSLWRWAWVVALPVGFAVTAWFYFSPA